MNDVERRRLLLERKKAILSSRSSLLAFAKYMSPDPDHRADVRHSAYQDAKHHRVIATALEEIEAGRFKKLMISCPPRHGKTRLASILLPAWYIGRHPRDSMIVATYNEIYGGDLGRAVRELMTSNLYRHIFPEVELRYGGANSMRLQTTSGADVFFTGVNGSITGRGGDLNLLDDPIKNRRDADSPRMRELAWNWYTQVFRPRFMTKDAKLVIISTRWHEDDLIGRHLDPSSPYYNEAEAASWHIINLPALAEDGDPLGREEGEALWPERFDVEFLEGMRRNDARGFTALYQGRPTPAEGAFFRADFLRLYHKMADAPPKEALRFYAASDHAVALKQENDKTCMMVVGVDQEDNLWVMPDVIWGRYPTNLAVEQMLHLMDRYRPVFWWAETGVITKSIGPFLRKRMLEKRVFCSLDEINPIADKQSRAQSINARMNMGKVYFPSFARWWADARDQILKFPQGTFDDFVDTLSLIGLGLVKQRPQRIVKVIREGPQPFTLGWVKALSKKNDRQNSTARTGWM